MNEGLFGRSKKRPKTSQAYLILTIMTDPNWQQGSLVELEITGLSNSGEGLGRFQERVVFVPDTVTGDRVLVRLVRVKQQYAQGQLQEIISPSAHRVRPPCIVADKCGGCQWQHIDETFQRESKQQQIIDALERIGQFSEIPIAPLLATTQIFEYRNKSTYPLARSSEGQVQAGYYRPQSHKIINLNQCPVQDPRLNPLLAEVKQDIQTQGWSIYDETERQGKLRHLALRIGRRTGEILLTLVSANPNLPGIEEQAQVWLDRYPHLVGVTLNHQPNPTNLILGAETQLIAGMPYCREIFAGLQFNLRSDTFFQVNTEAAELLWETILQQLNLQGWEQVIDAYSGVGTFTLPLAQKVESAIAIESNKSAVQQARENAEINHIENVQFLAGKVENVLPGLTKQTDMVILDPPRKGCDRRVIDTLCATRPKTLLYISCQPATLARDLKILCQEGGYQLTWVQGADFFPQTAHVECAVILQAR